MKTDHFLRSLWFIQLHISDMVSIQTQLDLLEMNKVTISILSLFSNKLLSCLTPTVLENKHNMTSLSVNLSMQSQIEFYKPVGDSR